MAKNSTSIKERFDRSGIKIENSDITLACLSLKIAINKYCETFTKFRSEKKFIRRDISESPLYFEHYAEIILHFQHFFELIVKDILRKEHEILAISARENQIFSILYKSIKRQKILSEELSGFNSLEFSESFKRIKQFSVKSSAKRERVRKVLVNETNAELIDYLNYLRNKTIHRGIFYLKEPQLDDLVCNYILPIISKIAATKSYPEIEKHLPKPAICGVDFLKEITKRKRSNTADVLELNLLKEIGRASYNSPIASLNETVRKEAATKRKPGKLRFGSFAKHMIVDISREGIIKAEALSRDSMSHVFKCPVCGQNALVAQEIHDYDDDAGNISFVSDISCHVCSFTVHNDNDINLSAKPFGIIDYFAN